MKVKGLVIHEKERSSHEINFVHLFSFSHRGTGDWPIKKISTYLAWFVEFQLSLVFQKFCGNGAVFGCKHSPGSFDVHWNIRDLFQIYVSVLVHFHFDSLNWNSNELAARLRSAMVFRMNKEEKQEAA